MSQEVIWAMRQHPQVVGLNVDGEGKHTLTIDSSGDDAEYQISIISRIEERINKARLEQGDKLSDSTLSLIARSVNITDVNARIASHFVAKIKLPSPGRVEYRGGLVFKSNDSDDWPEKITVIDTRSVRGIYHDIIKSSDE